MTFFLHIFIGACLIVFQAVIMPHFPFSSSFYDLLIPFIVYLGAYRPIRESIPAVLILGFIMDGFSGGAFGVYATTYLWLTLSMRWISTVIHLSNYMLWPVILAIGVLIENGLLFLAVKIANPEFHFSFSKIGVVSAQVFWILFTGPFFLIFFSNIFDPLIAKEPE